MFYVAPTHLGFRPSCFQSSALLPLLNKLESVDLALKERKGFLEALLQADGVEDVQPLRIRRLHDGGEHVCQLLHGQAAQQISATKRGIIALISKLEIRGDNSNDDQIATVQNFVFLKSRDLTKEKLPFFNNIYQSVGLESLFT